MELPAAREFRLGVQLLQRLTLLVDDSAVHALERNPGSLSGMGSRRTTIAALITSHNRREVTIRCLRSLVVAAQRCKTARVHVVAVDDGSTDGTGEAVRREFPAAQVVVADGSLYWCRGMALAWGVALQADEPFDAYLWLNDDVELGENSIADLLETSGLSQGDGAIAVGTVADPRSGERTYGGLVRRSSWHPGRLEPLEPLVGQTQCVDTFNGNVVLVPHCVVDRIGTIDPSFSHGFGDVDYGLRASAAGIPARVTPRVVGVCERNAEPVRSLRMIFSRKGLPPRDWLIFTRRHGPRFLWPFVFVAPYVRAVLSPKAWRSDECAAGRAQPNCDGALEQ